MPTETIITNRRNKNDTYRREMLLPGTYRFLYREIIAFTKEREYFSVKILKTEKKCLKKGKRWGTMVSSGRKW